MIFEVHLHRNVRKAIKDLPASYKEELDFSRCPDVIMWPCRYGAGTLGTDQEQRQVYLTALIIYEYRINIKTTLEKLRKNYGDQKRRNED
ncbi:Uncharacterised protein [uncultured archaeon]|nr:Uncharacterised protein [uncultured archaeon]